MSSRKIIIAASLSYCYIGLENTVITALLYTRRVSSRRHRYVTAAIIYDCSVATLLPFRAQLAVRVLEVFTSVEEGIMCRIRTGVVGSVIARVAKCS